MNTPGILRGDFGPGQALKPQELAKAQGVSLGVVRGALVRLVGDGAAEHRALEEAVLARDADTAVELLRRHQEVTVEGLGRRE